jgi:acyl CoA:acetate/3-ketoacid CoA transferase beta subunit
MQVVDLVVTDLGMFAPTGDQFRIVELAKGVKREDLHMAPELLQDRGVE